MIKAKMTQIILYVEDMARAVHFYKDLLGLKVTYPGKLTDAAQEMWVELDAGGCSLALHGGAQDRPDDQHELIFKVKDLAQARMALVNAGIHVAEIRILEDGAPIAEGVDPDGHRFGLR
jgi:predicted enzyme related to lactoylglutathione lyase